MRIKRNKGSCHGVVSSGWVTLVACPQAMPAQATASFRALKRISQPCAFHKTAYSGMMWPVDCVICMNFLSSPSLDDVARSPRGAFALPKSTTDDQSERHTRKSRSALQQRQPSEEYEWTDSRSSGGQPLGALPDGAASAPAATSLAKAPHSMKMKEATKQSSLVNRRYPNPNAISVPPTFNVLRGRQRSSCPSHSHCRPAHPHTRTPQAAGTGPQERDCPKADSHSMPCQTGKAPVCGLGTFSAPQRHSRWPMPPHYESTHSSSMRWQNNRCHIVKLRCTRLYQHRTSRAHRQLREQYDGHLKGQGGPQIPGARPRLLLHAASAPYLPFCC